MKGHIVQGKADSGELDCWVTGIAACVYDGLCCLCW